MGVKTKLKSMTLALARPVWHRLWARIEMHIAASNRGEQLLQRHPAAFLDAVSTVAALGRQVRQLQQQVAALQQRQPTELCSDAIELSLRTDDAAAGDRLLQAARPALRAGTTVQLRLCSHPAAPDVLGAATAAAEWLRGHEFADVQIAADTASPTVTVSARLAA
jgi:hypothetical protein